MLTKEVHGAGNNCKPLHASEINIYDVCALREQNIRLKVGGRKFTSDTSTDAGKCAAAPSHMCETVSYVGAGSGSGCSCGHPFLHNLSLYKCCNSYADTGAGKGRGTLDPQTFCFSGLT